MNAATQHAMRLTRVIAADPETVFEAWTEPEHMKNWSAPEGMEVPFVEVDLRVGGKFRLTMRNAEGRDFTGVGDYREVDPPRRVSYTWDWEEGEYQVGETLITVDFNPVDGGTEVVMRHEFLPSEEALADHTKGWTSCLNRLEAIFA
jgi:uncharacterized protein YndB with AHSA1/START domain